MKAARFNELDLVDKAWLVSEYGDLLMSIEHYDYRVFLFSLNSEFIEMYQHIDSRQIEKICIASYRDMDKYMPRILIGSLSMRR